MCLSLPWLEALVPTQARGQSAGESPLRFIPVYFPNGAAAEFWGCSGQGGGDAWSLSPILDPFASLKSKMIAFTNLENYTCMQADQFVEPSHARCTSAYLTCEDSDSIREGLGAETANGISLDQRLAELLQPSTAFASMQLGLSTLESFTDGRHGSYSRSISWKGETEPLYKEVNPQTVFDMLVGGLAGGNSDPAADAAGELRRALDKSVLDAVLENATRTRARLGVEDQRRLDKFLNSVRETEKQVLTVGTAMAQNCTETARPGSPAQYGVANGQDGYDRKAHCDAMNSLIVMALSCDATRIVSYMLDDARSDFVYDHLTNRKFEAAGSTAGDGQVGQFHGLQHAGDSNDGYATINWWFSDRVAALCTALDQVQEGDKTLLDNCVVLYGSGMHGSNHDANELPITLIGGGGGRLKTDQHLVFAPTPNDRPLRDLYYTLMREVYQVEVSSFGSSLSGQANSTMDEILV